MVLCSPTINLLNQGYRLYLHNYYLKEELLLYSHDNKTHETGTAHADRSGFPKCIIHKSKWGFPWGSDEWRINGPVLAQVWMDNKPAYFMTTLHRPIHQIDTPQNKEVVRRKGKKGEKNGTGIPCPLCISDYNNNMGDIDYSIQIMKYYNCGRKSKKWYKHVFYHLLELSIHNSFVLESYFVTFKNLTSKRKTYSI